MFITLVPSYVAPMYSYATNVFVYNPYITVCVCKYSYATRMYLYVLVCYSYIPVCYMILLVFTSMYSYVNCYVLFVVFQCRAMLDQRLFHFGLKIVIAIHKC